VRALLIALLALGCTTTHVQAVEDAAAGHRLACELAKTQPLTDEERAAVEAACAVRCEPAE
jgi:hypothetical protein